VHVPGTLIFICSRPAVFNL